MKFLIDDEVWFKDQDRDEEGYFIVNTFIDPNEGDVIYIAVDCCNCYVIGREHEFTKVENKSTDTKQEVDF